MQKNPKFKVKVLKSGPYEVIGKIPLNQALIKTNSEGESKSWDHAKSYEVEETYHLCRCGHSENKPFCDGAHIKKHFTGEEVASKEPYIKQSKRYKGEEIDLLDQENLCVGARFCDPLGGVWLSALRSSRGDNKNIAMQQACDCPAGRLTVVLKDGTMVEKTLPQEISLVEDVVRRTKGPLWVKGGILIEDSDGEAYEVRNRVTLCRCGESENMPFCDASHYYCSHMKGLDKK